MASMPADGGKDKSLLDWLDDHLDNDLCWEFLSQIQRGKKARDVIKMLSERSKSPAKESENGR